MAKITEQVLDQIKELYEQDKTCALARKTTDESNWLTVTFSEVRADTAAKEIIDSFGSERKFLVALAEYLSETILSSLSDKPSPVNLDFVDRMQDRVI